MKKHNRIPAIASLIVMICLHSACATQQARETDTSKRIVPQQTRADGSIRHDTTSARVAQLWAAAEKSRAADRLEEAEDYIQQALAIVPEDSVLWSRAAELKMSLLEPALAENYASKSIAYAAENRTLLHRNWLIIEHARELRGDLLGVRDAHKMVQQYQY